MTVASASPLLSIVTPAYRETANIPVMYERLKKVLATTHQEWEWIIVDDHSPDATFAVVAALAQKDTRVRGIRFARNFGAPVAAQCGLLHARGNCAVMMAADLQDPPETIPALLEKWRSGAQIVWAVRAARHGEKASTRFFARLYYWIMRKLIGMKEMPPSGADFFLIDREVMNALRQFNEASVSLLALLLWMGYRQEHIYYEKQPRLHGESGWSLGKKLRLVSHSITSFSFFPIRLLSMLGILMAFLGFLYAGFVFLTGFFGRPAQGWASLMVVQLLIGGIQMIMIGVLGEYLWRVLDEARRRPKFLIEARIPQPDLEPPGTGAP